MKGLAPHTSKIFESVSMLDCIKPYLLVGGTALSFYSSPKFSPVTTPVAWTNNLNLADVKSIGAMKMEVMMRRSNFRDYYDIYSILQTGIPMQEMIALALEYSDIG